MEMHQNLWVQKDCDALYGESLDNIVCTLYILVILIALLLSFYSLAV